MNICIYVYNVFLKLPSLEHSFLQHVDLCSFLLTSRRFLVASPDVAWNRSVRPLRWPWRPRPGCRARRCGASLAERDGENPRHMGVSKNRGYPQIIRLEIGLSLIFTIHFWVFSPYFGKHPYIACIYSMYSNSSLLHGWWVWFESPLARLVSFGFVPSACTMSARASKEAE